MPPKPKGQQRTLASLWGNTGSKKKTFKEKQEEEKKDDQAVYMESSNSISTKQVKPDNSKTSAAKSTPKEGDIANGTLVKKRESASTDLSKDTKFSSGKVISYNSAKKRYTVSLTSSSKRKSTQQWTEAQVEWGVTLQQNLNVQVANKFDGLTFKGKVVDASIEDNEALFKVLFEDGDEEDYDDEELKSCIKLYAKEFNSSKKRSSSHDDKSVKKRKQIVEDDSDDDVEMIDENPGTSRGTRSSPRRKASMKSTKAKDDEMVIDDEEGEEARKTVDSESEFEEASDESDDDELDEEAFIDEEEENDDEIMDEGSDEEAVTAKPTKKKSISAKNVTKKLVKQKTKPSATDSNAEIAELVQKKRDTNACKATNNPQELPNEQYVEPVGIDATDGIVEGIVGGMVKKLGSLFVNATKFDEKKREIGELNFPLKLQTACSGTDAPSIALGLVKEALDKLRTKDGEKMDHGFNFSHEMSCEIEPFKQAYIGRNFPGVLLFPDITKLTGGDTVTDVYGREQSIPEGNLFVAGTSCKDFSMLKSSNRKDIEDKGTSGETFLAAVEFLEQEQPPVAIFENVDGAPWDKMQEYIKGRIFLGDRNSIKNITGLKKGDADNQLKFSVDNDGNYVAEEVPKQVGIRAGTIVEGFVKFGDNSNNVRPLLHEGKKTLITLGKLAKLHGISLKNDTLVMKKKARYCTQLVKLDTKEYGLPQTRNRKYLFIWRSDNPDDNLGEYFLEIMSFLKTPLLYPMEAFLLPDTHDRIRCFREALRSGQGLLVANERSKELDFWDYAQSGVKDLALHIHFREVNDIEERCRWLTNWDTRGRHKIAPGLWPELVSMWNMRRKDLIDCFASSAIRDNISRDCMHHSFTWDLSQNVNRATVRAKTVGVSGCVTPGGELLLPNRGRTMMGYEKLLLQGIPFSRLLLGPESEVQLSDLAGNAMSLPVVCATMLAAICAPQLRREREKDQFVKLSKFSIAEKYDAEKGDVLRERGDLLNVNRESEGDFYNVFRDISEKYAEQAYYSSVLCTCESSGRSTDDDKILECKNCGFGTCHTCSNSYQICSHALKEVGEEVSRDNRPDPHEFERTLRCVCPSILRLGQGWENAIKECKSLESYSFQIQNVQRKRGHWTLLYGAWEDFGAGRQVAELRVTIGRIQTLDSNMGVTAAVKCFGPAIRHDKPKRGTILDSARLIINKDGVDSAGWEKRVTTSKQTLQVVGSDPCDSQRVLAGIGDGAPKSIKSHKVMKAKIPKKASRNDVLNYHKKWKEWPGKIEISGDESGTVNGTYHKQDCHHTVVLSALWRRDKTENQPAMYILIRPEVIRSDFDVAVISTSPSYNDRNMEVCEILDWIPENALETRTHATKAKFHHWEAVPNLAVGIPKQSIRVSFCEGPESFREEKSDNPILCQLAGLSQETMNSLLQHTEIDAMEKCVNVDLYGKLGTQNAKRLSIVAAPSLHKYAAQGDLALQLSVKDEQKWFTVLNSSSNKYGQSERYFPFRPKEIWEKVKDAYQRSYDPRESNDYYQKLFNRPNAFTLDVNTNEGKMNVRMNVHVACHQAAGHLIRSRGLDDDYMDTVNVDFCLSELSSMGEPSTKAFHVPNSDGYDETVVNGMKLPLYKRQAKALTRMQSIERGAVEFSEEERSEHVLPGVGWCLIARARKRTPLKGGVLGDAIGSGKTVVTIALILSGIENARSNCNISEGVSSASLIVVPPGLVKQWDDERKKFTGSKMKCITIDSTASLKKYSVKDICQADIIIVPAGLIEEKGKKTTDRPYTEHLARKAGAEKIPPAPRSYSQREAPSIEGTWVRNMASGPSIYVGNNGKQRVRDEQAYYGHCYSEAIKKLRQKKFDASDRGVPLEYFTWERVIVDECHESLVTANKQESIAEDFKAQARRGAREFLGVSHTDASSRPLIARKAVWGLTGTPLLETESRVTELANLMGGTYLTGSAHHWRKEERESGRDLFLNQQEASNSREYRRAVQDSCHTYVKEACQRNRGEKLQVNLQRKVIHVNMSKVDGKKFLASVGDSATEQADSTDSFTLNPDQIGEKASAALTITASSSVRHDALNSELDTILEDEPETKVIVFANAFYGGYNSALDGLKASNHRFCHIGDSDSVQRQNEIISWFRHIDATEEDRKRPRILLLSFEQAAGHNLQEACHNVIMYDPMYSGPDAVADCSVEEQALGRVMRQGQKSDVTVTRIAVRGPNGERCLDDVIIERNLDEDVLNAATSNFD